ncbi:MAG: CoA transferase [SAR324 cluster bacterium]|nr:CoA transferase [SAR324 cluster bacterium]
MNGILNGMRVVEGSAFVAAPSGGMTLASLGADVIRFDLPGGGLDYKRWPVAKSGQSLYWAGLNKGKRSITVDFRTPKGQEILTALICSEGENKGLFLTNFPAKGWLDYENLKKRRSDLIMLNVKGDRHGGSQVDYTVNPRVGFPTATGFEDSEPVNHMLPAWDLITGQMGAVGLLAAERHRRLTGQGQLINLPLADVAMATLGNLGIIGEVMINKEDRPRYGNFMYGAFGKDFETKDGKRIMIIAISLRQWSGLCRATDSTEEMEGLSRRLKLDFREEGNRFLARESIAALLIPWMKSHDLQEIEKVFEANGVCWGPYQTFREFVESDPECTVENPLFKKVNQPGIGDYLVPGYPVDFSAVPRVEPGPAPELGADTDEVLSIELGLSDSEIGKLHDQKIVV